MDGVLCLLSCTQLLSGPPVFVVIGTQAPTAQLVVYPMAFRMTEGVPIARPDSCLHAEVGVDVGMLSIVIVVESR
jgi:hypothetical protein